MGIIEQEYDGLILVDYCITVNMGEVRTLVGQGVGATAPPGQGGVQHVPLFPKVNTAVWHTTTMESVTKYATKYIVSQDATLEAGTKAEAGGGGAQC